MLRKGRQVCRETPRVSLVKECAEEAGYSIYIIHGDTTHYLLGETGFKLLGRPYYDYHGTTTLYFRHKFFHQISV